MDSIDGIDEDASVSAEELSSTTPSETKMSEEEQRKLDKTLRKLMAFKNPFDVLDIDVNTSAEDIQ